MDIHSVTSKFLTKSKAFAQKTNALSKQMHSTTSPFAACHFVGRPVWTPRQYEALANVGYTQNVMVFRCVNLIAKSLSSIHWLLYEQCGDNDYEINQHPLLELLRVPSKDQAGTAFLEQLLSEYLLSGNAYIAAHVAPNGKPSSLEVLRSARVQVLIDKSDQLVGYAYQKGKEKKIVALSDHATRILHIKTFNPLNDWYGMSPIEAAARAIDQHNAVGEHNLAILQNGGRPSGALLVRPSEHGQTLTQEQRDALRYDLSRLYEGVDNAGRIMILEGNCEWKEMGFSPKDLDFHEGKKISAREITQAFGVPPILVGLTENATFSNYKEARLHFWEDTLIPLLNSFIAEFNRWLTPFFGKNLRLGFDPDTISALAIKRDQIWSKLQDASFLTINEKRNAVGYGPIPNGDVLDTPSHKSVSV